MPKNISFLILNNDGSLLKKGTLHNFIVLGGLIFFLTGVFGFGYLLYEYVNIQKVLTEKTELEEKQAAQALEISSQKKQIQTFASKIDLLWLEIDRLNQFEKKIRVIASIENDDDNQGVFGIGGPAHEDLDNPTTLDETQNEHMHRMHQQVHDIELAAVNQKNRFESLVFDLENQLRVMASTPAIRPVKGVVTSSFGYRISPFNGLRDFHSGLDIGAKTGTPIKATADGIVTFAGKKGFFGNLVVIDHDHGMLTRYAHLSKILVSRGDFVKRGELIGEVGNTGRSTGSHLHYEVHLNGVPVNPKKYILN